MINNLHPPLQVGQASASLGVLGAVARTARGFLPLHGRRTELCGLQWSRGHREEIWQLPGVWSILWLAFILTVLGSTGPELQTKVCQNHQAPHSSGCCGVSAPAPAPGAALKGDPLPHGHQGGEDKCPWTHCSSGLKPCFWPGCLVLSLAWA